MERASAPAALPVSENITRPGETFDIIPVAAESARGAVKIDTEEMAHTRGEGVAGSTPTPSPSGSGQTATHMELTHTDRTGGDGASETDHPAAGSINNPIDLTQEDNALQKALALSLQDMQQSTSGAQISLEDQELSRALEASLAERQGSLQHMGLSLTGISVDPLNPHERERQGQSPVGLKNIGNTCWFSAVIQSLFHIPEFRAVVLQFQPPPLSSSEQSQHHCLLFLVELRRLFALLVASRRKYINPQRAIQALKAAFTEQTAVTAVQQDVSEFTHKLLEWIEIAFKTAAGNNDHNPVVKLFTGHCRTEGLLEGQTFVNESDFGAFPIQVQGHSHLHDSLEAACVSSEMGQETWFTALPPILVLELSRFSFNQSSSMAEKLHSQLTFDLTLAMDRYLERNREEVRLRRKEVAALKLKLQELRTRLSRFTHYQGHSVSVQEVLQLTLDFAREQSSATRTEVVENDSDDGESEAGTGEKCPRTSVGPEPRYISPEERATLEQCLVRWKEEVKEDISDLREGVSSTEDSLAAVYGSETMNSTRYHLHAVLVHQGQASGGHYWSYVRKPPSLHVETAPAVEVTGVTETKLYQTVSISEAMSSPAMSTESGAGEGEGKGGGERDSQLVSTVEKTPGEKESAKNDKKEGEEEGGVWLKFNDVSVYEVGWAEVVKESYGGHHNTSAYCLIYLSPQLHKAWASNGGETVLKPDLQCMVEEDNAAFMEEIAEYDAKKEREKQRQTDLAGSDQPHSILAPVSAATSDHARPVGPKHDRSPEQMQVDSPPLPPVDLSLMSELKARMQAQYQRLGGDILKERKRMGREEEEDEEYEMDSVQERLSNICSYLILSGLAEDERVEPSLHVLLLQAVEGECEGGGKEGLRLLAKKEIVSAMLRPGMQYMMNELRGLHVQLKVITHHFIYGVHCLAQKSLQKALVRSVCAYKMNCELAKKAGEKAGLDLLMLGLLRRKALLEVSISAMEMFDQGHVRAALETATVLLVPALKSMSELPCPGDEQVIERVREDWCNCLTHPSLSDGEQDQLADLLTRMFEEYSKSADLNEPPAPPHPALDSTHLSADYYNVVQQLRQLVKL